MRMVVTGASGGLGHAVATYSLAEGDLVAGVDLERQGDDFGSGRYTAIQADVTSMTAIKSAIDKAIDFLGHIDAVIHCAGLAVVGTVTDLRPDDWDRCISVNVTGTFNVMHEVIPHMVHSGSGSIVNVCSISATHAMRSVAAYAASKGAVASLTRAIARDYARHGLRANTILPGTFVSPMSIKTYSSRENDPEAALQRAGQAYPLGRLGSTDDIAPLAHFLASEKSSWITGAEFVADGGISAIAGV